MTDLEAAWGELHDAKPAGLYVGRPAGLYVGRPACCCQSAARDWYRRWESNPHEVALSGV